MGDEVVMEMEIQMLDQSLGRKYFQFNTVGQLRAAALSVYSATAADNSSNYSLKSNRGIVFHMYEEEMQSYIMERFYKEMKNRIPDYSYQNKPLNSLVINYIFNDINHKWVGSETGK